VSPVTKILFNTSVNVKEILFNFFDLAKLKDIIFMSLTVEINRTLAITDSNFECMS
jgi:hypothetical protein